MHDAKHVDILKVYESFSDSTRLRILHLLMQRDSICVCHMQSVLEETQVKVSRHLAYLRRRGLVEAEQRGNWRYYSLPRRRSREFELNLQCLTKIVSTHATFQRDLKRLTQHEPEVETCSSC